MSVRWTKGYTQAELDSAQHRFGLVFPPDLVALLREKRPRRASWPSQIKYIPFWSDLVEHFAQNRNRPA